jgi:hypothetical protein
MDGGITLIVAPNSTLKLLPLSSIITGPIRSSFQTDPTSEIHLDVVGKVGDAKAISIA